MKLLFDENLSYRLSNILRDSFAQSVHVRDVGLKAEPDTTVWQYARDNDFIIVSKDSDFHQRSLLLGCPPKVVWLKLGNCPSSTVERLLRDNLEVILQFNDEDGASFLILSE